MTRHSITERVLRRLLKESSRLNEDVNANNLAALIGKTGDMYTAVVYDPTTAVDALEVIDDPDNEIWSREVIKGVVVISPPSNPCWNAWEVSNIAGRGLGKTLYGIAYAMTPDGMLMSDRNLVSPSARKAWAKAAASSRRRKPFDDVMNPKTPEREDDCIVHDYPRTPENPLNNAYEAEGWEAGLLQSLRSQHKATMKFVPHEQAQTFVDRLERGAEDFWNKNYFGT